MMITATDVSKRFLGPHGAKQVLTNVSFEMPEGGHLGIVGPAGSGKSTVLNMIGGLVYPDAGKIKRNGTVSWITGRMRFERTMTVTQNLRFLGRILGYKDFDDMYARVQDVTGFTTQMKATFEQLDEPEKKLLNFATSLVFDFDIMLFDGAPYGGPEVKDRIEPLINKKLEHSMAVMTAATVKDLSDIYTHILVLADQGAELYDDRKEASKAMKKALAKVK
ncbi:ATP-binding cassette domain-containing protein [Kordiimonas marina]|uniref:ATP-binding cassette domain-containing protein n=1 Tax=Kordiimonas marina TaxID=2872312 RepID=UPI001FF43278|nr:ATP-binding cassette domain-containing protein [Kordiimonas marina]MCJ9428722.1 ATP-binding cassette domain-containing protein [Kordiimonas marina]